MHFWLGPSCPPGPQGLFCKAPLSPGAGFGTCWTPWVFRCFISAACPHPSACQLDHLAYQPLLPALCCLQACCKLLEGALCPGFQAANEDVKHYWSQNPPVPPGYSPSDWPPNKLHAAGGSDFLSYSCPSESSSPSVDILSFRLAPFFFLLCSK